MPPIRLYGYPIGSLDVPPDIMCVHTTRPFASRPHRPANDHKCRKPIGGVMRGFMVHVDHRRLDVRVTHVRLYVGQREHLHGKRAEDVPECAVGQAPEAGVLLSLVVAPA